MRLASLFPMLLFCSPILADEPSQPVQARRELTNKVKLREAYPLSMGNYQGRARISVDDRMVSIGERFDVTLRFRNTSDAAYDILSPALARAQAVTLAIFDHNGRFIGSLLVPLGVHSISLGLNYLTWCRLPPGQEMEAYVVPCWAGLVGATEYLSVKFALPPGKYYIQAIYNDYFASSCPWYEPAVPCGLVYGAPTPEELDKFLPLPEPVREFERHENREKMKQIMNEWYRKYDGEEICRSNIIEMTFLPRPVKALRP